MKMIGSILYLDFNELIDAGISSNTVKRAKQRESSGWAFVQDPDDGRKVLVAYEPLKVKYKEAIICKYGDPYCYCSADVLNSFIRSRTEDLKGLRDFRLGNGSGLPEKVIEDYSRACDLLYWLTHLSKKEAKQLFGSTKTMYDAVASYIDSKGLQLPKNYAKLKLKEREYKKRGYRSVISKKWGNQNSLKIEGDVANWLLAKYAQPTKCDVAQLHFEYNVYAPTMTWPLLSESAIYRYLQQPEVMIQWYLPRHGKKAYKNQFGHTMKLKGPTYRDAMWVADGTKLNCYYQDKNVSHGFSAKLKIMKVADAYSECILGHDLSFTEDSVSIYQAFKQAVQSSMQLPTQILYDGQGGFKRGEMQTLLHSLSEVDFPAKPYNPQSKSIESIIGRFQKQVMRKYWFFTGQNMTATSADSKVNMDFILERKNDLPTMEQVKALVPKMIEAWNNAPHPHQKDKSRRQVYLESINPSPRPMDYLDFVNTFWLEKPRTIKYYPRGLRMEWGGEAYEYEVYAEDGYTPAKVMEQHYNTGMLVQFDPEDLSGIRLYKPYGDGDRQFIAVAQLKNEYARFVGDLNEGMRGEISALLELRDKDMEERVAQMKLIEKRTGVTTKTSEVPTESFDWETVAQIGFRGDKEDMNEAEGFAVLDAASRYKSEESSDSLEVTADKAAVKPRSLITRTDESDRLSRESILNRI